MPPSEFAEVLFVSKPLAPPWDDSGKLLPYSIARRLQGVRVAVMTPRGADPGIPGAVREEVYGRPSSFSVPGRDKVRVLWRLLARETPPVVHFFFSPNPATCFAARLFRRARPHARVVQTVMSLPDNPRDLAAGLFADVVVTWSRVAADLASRAAAGRPGGVRVVHVPPGIEPLAPMSPDERRAVRIALGLPPDRPLVLFAGDLEFSSAAMQVAAAAHAVVRRVPAVFVFACRPKTPAARLVAEDLSKALGDLRERGHAFVMGRVERFHDLVRAADCQVLPADTTYAKTDIPLVVLEGLSAGVPAIVGQGTPMDELIEAGAAVGVPPLVPSAIADALEGLLLRRGAPSFGAAGRAFVLSRHTAEAMATAHAEIYRDLLRL
ncbi:MAG: glycosyltransferase [Deltaproteobacteria bacterium]|nr:glycosyltransferase [Deltaproteobacteria bacterium]